MDPTFKLFEVDSAANPFQFQSNQAVSNIFTAVDQNCDREIVGIAAVGQGRVGKSTYLNYLIGWLIHNRLVNVGVGVLNAPINIFRTSDGADPATRGVDAWVAHLVNGKTLLIMDAEGVNNQDRPDLSVMLALVSQLCNHMFFMDHGMNDVFFNTLGRLVGTRMVGVADGGQIAWPHLHAIFNPTRIAVTTENFTQRFNGAGVPRELNDAFPANRRDVVTIPDAGRALAPALFREIAVSPYGVAMDAYFRTLNLQDQVLVTPIRDSVANIPLTQASYLAFFRETLRGTNRNLAAGRLVAQPPAGLEGIVAESGRLAKATALVEFRRIADRNPITGRETAEALNVALRGGRRAALASFDRQMNGFNRFPAMQGRRQELEREIARLSEQAELLRAARAQAIEQERVLAEQAAQIQELINRPPPPPQIIYRNQDNDDNDCVIC